MLLRSPTTLLHRRYHPAPHFTQKSSPTGCPTSSPIIHPAPCLNQKLIPTGSPIHPTLPPCPSPSLCLVPPQPPSGDLSVCAQCGHHSAQPAQSLSRCAAHRPSRLGLCPTTGPTPPSPLPHHPTPTSHRPPTRSARSTASPHRRPLPCPTHPRPPTLNHPQQFSMRCQRL